MTSYLTIGRVQVAGGRVVEERIIQTEAGVVRYRPIDGLPGYWVGDDGTVWSTHARGYRGGIRNDVWLPLAFFYTAGSRYRRIRLNYRPSNRYVHRLVLEAFVGPCPVGMQCRHLDGDPHNNRINNLCWGTPDENHVDKVRHGTSPVGERNPLARLTAGEVLDIRRQASAGVTHRRIAAQYGVHRSTVGQIARRTNWRHLS